MKQKSVKITLNNFFDRLREFPYILRPLWFIILFQWLVLVVFWLLPQGQDLLLAIMEDIANDDKLTFFWFILAIAFWSATSEFGSRFILYLADVSAHQLEKRRVRARKHVLKLVSKVVLFMPIISAYGGFLIAYVTHLDQEGSAGGFVLVTLSLGTLSLLLYWIYFGFLRERIYVLYSNNKTPMHARLRYRVQVSYLAKLYSIFHHRIVTEPEAERIAAETSLSKEELMLHGFTPSMGFYKPLFVRFSIFISLSVLSIFVFSFLFIEWYYLVGSLALLTLAFGCWFTVYYAIELIDRLKPFGLRISYKLFIILWLIFVSYVNDDHPIRPSDSATTSLADNSVTITRQFEKWVMESSRIDTSRSFPVVLIAAEGGALRTGCFTSMMLAAIQDTFPHFKQYIFCYSSVSGGTLGVGVFNGLNLIDYNKSYSEAVKRFYDNDFLAPVIGKLAFGEVLGLFYPAYVPAFDRAAALEKAWETGWVELDSGDRRNFLSHAFHQLPDLKHPQAIHLINSTEVESGYRAILGNIKIDPDNFIKVVDVASKLQYPVNYSTAISISARFPLVSPAATIQHGCDQQYHYVDGGYFENKGATTLNEVLGAIRKSPFSRRADFYVIQFNFGPDNLGDPKGIALFSQIREIINGIYNVRAGHTDHSKELLRRATEAPSDSSVFISLDLQRNSKQVPLNWTLSRRAVDDVDDFCREELRRYLSDRDRLESDSSISKLLMRLKLIKYRKP
jgi:hypothetical protein